MNKNLIILTILALVLALTTGVFQAQDHTPITLDNASSISQLRRIGRGTAEIVEYSPNGDIIAVGSSVGVWLYDAAAVDSLAEPPLLVTSGEVTAMAYSPDGSTIAVANSDTDEVQLWDVASMSVSSTFTPENDPAALAYSPDGTMLAMNNSYRGVAVWDIAKNAVVLMDDSVSLDSGAPIAFSTDGTKVASGNSSGTIFLWDVAAGGAAVELAALSRTPQSIIFNPDGSSLVAVSSDPKIAIWGVDGSEIMIIEETDEFEMEDVYAAAFSPDGATLVTGHRSGDLMFWDASGGMMKMGANDDGTPTNIVDLPVSTTTRGISFSPDGSQMAIIVEDFPTAVQLLDASGAQLAVAPGHNDSITGISFSPDSAVLAFGDSDQFLYLWDTATAGEITEAIKFEDGTSFNAESVTTIVYSSNGEYLATEDGFTVALRNPTTGDLIRELEADGLSSDIVFSPDDTMLAFVTSEAFYVYSVETGEMLVNITDHNDWVNDVEWSPDQSMIATHASDNTIRVYTVGGE